MDLKATISNEEPEFQDEVLNALHSDQLFNDFDPLCWSSTQGVDSSIVEKVLAKHRFERGFDELVKRHQ